MSTPGIAVALLALLIFAPAHAWSAEATDCDHSEARPFASPDGRWTARVQEEVCAVATGTGAGVVVDLILAADATHSQRIFSMRVPRSRDEWPRVVWSSPTAMVLWVPNRAEINKSPPADFEGVRIELKYCGDNPEERAQVVAYQAAFKKWMQDTTAWAAARKQDPELKTPRPKRPEEPTYSPDTCAGVGQ